MLDPMTWIRDKTGEVGSGSDGFRGLMKTCAHNVAFFIRAGALQGAKFPAFFTFHDVGAEPIEPGDHTKQQVGFYARTCPDCHEHRHFFSLHRFLSRSAPQLMTFNFIKHIRRDRASYTSALFRKKRFIS